MQIPQPGQEVRARGARWRVADVRAYDACTVVTLASTVSRTERRLIHPFDVIEPLDTVRPPQIVPLRRCRDACRRLIADDAPPGSLRHARSARIDLMPHQLEPALALVSGRGTRVLLADDVGLGKTVEAGVILAELRGRGWIERVLVLTPAALRDQWRRELSDRFAIEAASLDASTVRRMSFALPVGINPWSTVRTAVASIDYVKRAEVFPAVSACRWDMLVVDEAHGVDGDSDRHDAVAALASRASYVLLLTATPHNGDRRSFASLCAIGDVARRLQPGDALPGDVARPLQPSALLVFRRTRQDIRLDATRRLHTLRVRPTVAERRVHALLARYCAAVRAERTDAWLALSVLHKRAFSGPRALHTSVSRRLAALDDATPTPDGLQMALPLGPEPGEETDADAAPAWPDDVGLADPIRERDLLTDLEAAARVAAAGHDSKAAVLRRLLRRAGDSVIVFTEYRDTLLHLAASLHGFRIAILHGGLTRDERESALRTFAAERGTVLLATDAAGEGLNLHQTCRLVVNLELPWNPMRLEQRIGRVDRIGQRRTVHAFHLVARNTGEGRILERLHVRVASARAAIAAPDPFGCVVRDLDRRVARLVMDGHWEDGEAALGTADHVEVETAAPDYSHAARCEAERLSVARAIGRDLDTSIVDATDGRTRIVQALRGPLRRALGSNALLLWRVALDNGEGAMLEAQLVPVLVRGVSRVRRHADLRAVVQALTSRVGEWLDHHAAPWSDAALHAVHSLADTRVARERSILAALDEVPSAAFQPGLFDRRAERAREVHTDIVAASRAGLTERLERIERFTDARVCRPTLLLALLP